MDARKGGSLVETHPESLFGIPAPARVESRATTLTRVILGFCATREHFGPGRGGISCKV